MKMVYFYNADVWVKLHSKPAQ